MLCALYEPVGHLHAVVVEIYRPVQLSHTHDLQQEQRFKSSHSFSISGPKFSNPVLLWNRNKFFSDPDPTFQIITVPDPDPVSDSTRFFLMFLT